MKYRKLRIAWSVACGVLCVLLVALWVRSYHRFDYLTVRGIVVSDVVEAQSFPGLLAIGYFEVPGGIIWNFETEEAQHIPESYPLLFRLESFEITGLSTLAIRYWFLVFLGVVLAGLSWLRWRFSLRTLLIGMTVVAAILGLGIWTAN
jgi:hypothetical protein